MTKIILVMALAATLLSTFTLGNNAFAIEPGDVSMIKTKKGTAICTTIVDPQPCGEGKIRAAFRLLTTEVENNIATGVTQGVIWLVDDSSGANVSLRSVNSGSWSYDFGFGLSVLTMEGTFEAKNGNSFEFEAEGVITDNGKKKSQINLNVILTTAEISISVDDLLGNGGLEFRPTGHR